MKDYMGSHVRTTFVGCGGTFYQATNIIRQWLYQTYEEKFSHLSDEDVGYLLMDMSLPIEAGDFSVFWVDPDTLYYGENGTRQWAQVGRSPASKVSVAHTNILGFENAFRLLDKLSSCSQSTFNQFVETLEGFNEGYTDVVVVNVDNDEARQDVMEWARKHPNWCLVVMTGCDENKGQAYIGSYGVEAPFYLDLQETHPDIGMPDEATPAPREGGCADASGGIIQTAESNALTAAFLAPLMKQVTKFLSGPQTEPVMMPEYYWKLDEAGNVKFKTLVSVAESRREEENVQNV